MTHLLRIGFVAFCLLLSACKLGVGVGVGYGTDHRWHRGDRHYDNWYDGSRYGDRYGRDRYNRDRYGRIDRYPHGRYPIEIYDNVNIAPANSPETRAEIGTVEEQALRLSQDYGLKESSAFKIISLMNSSNLKADLASMNLRTQDVAPLARFKMPSNASIRRMAAALHENEDAVATLIYDCMSDIQAQIAN